MFYGATYGKGCQTKNRDWRVGFFCLCLVSVKFKFSRFEIERVEMKLLEKFRKILSYAVISQLILTFLPAGSAAAVGVPETPTNVLPANHEIVNAQTHVDFSWNDSNVGATYRFEVSDSLSTDLVTGNFTGTVFESIDWADAYTVKTYQSGPLAEGTYYWHVKARYAPDNEGAWSSITDFTADNVFPVVTGVEEGGKYFNSVIVNYDHGAGTYTVDGGPGIVFASGATLSAVGVYQVTVSDGVNSTVVNFEITDQTQPILNTPADGVYINKDDLVKFKWNALGLTSAAKLTSKKAVRTKGVFADKIEYRLQAISSSNDFVAGPWEINSAWQEETNYLNTVTAEDVYEWRVQARDTNDTEGSWSSSWQFTIDNTPPVIDPMSDIVTNIPVNLSGSATDNNLEVNYKWSMVDGPAGGTATFALPHDPATEVSADIDGDYTLKLTATDKAGNSSSETIILTWDASVSPVSDFFVATGDGFVDLHWYNPLDPDFVGTDVYRGTSVGDLGTKIASFGTLISDFSDNSVINGKTYYYTVVSKDALGNTENSVQIGVTPTAATFSVPPYRDGITLLPTGGPEKPIVKDVGGEKDVKSSISDEDNTKTDDPKNSLPAVGIALLVVLALIGVYLLYLQNPAWFNKFFSFFKRK